MTQLPNQERMTPVDNICMTAVSAEFHPFSGWTPPLQNDYSKRFSFAGPSRLEQIRRTTDKRKLRVYVVLELVISEMTTAYSEAWCPTNNGPFDYRKDVKNGQVTER